MNIFLSYRTEDSKKADKLKTAIYKIDETIILVDHINASDDDEWKTKVYEKILNSDKVMMLISKQVKSNPNINWEFQIASANQKDVIAVSLEDDFSFDDCPKYLNAAEILPNIPRLLAEKIKSKIRPKDKTTLLDEYKMMVASTEKVTDQRLIVNNIFFTVTAAILSVSFFLIKELELNKISLLMLMAIMIMAILITCFWQKMVTSYGKLNKGKFVLIAEIEDQLKTNLYQREWQILTDEIQYKPNTQTERQIIWMFRIFIVIIGIAEFFYLLYKTKS
jgi:hypothetical protein